MADFNLGSIRGEAGTQIFPVSSNQITPITGMKVNDLIVNSGNAQLTIGNQTVAIGGVVKVITINGTTSFTSSISGNWRGAVGTQGGEGPLGPQGSAIIVSSRTNPATTDTLFTFAQLHLASVIIPKEGDVIWAVRSSGGGDYLGYVYLFQITSVNVTTEEVTVLYLRRVDLRGVGWRTLYRHDFQFTTSGTYSANITGTIISTSNTLLTLQTFFQYLQANHTGISSAGMTISGTLLSGSIMYTTTKVYATTGGTNPSIGGRAISGSTMGNTFSFTNLSGTFTDRVTEVF